MELRGYVDCACQDCFDITISGNEDTPWLCWECLEAGCETGEHECSRDDAYGQGEES